MSRLPYKYIVSITFVVGIFINLLDTTIVNVALPTLQEEFDATTTEIQWVVTAYLVALGVFIPVSGWAGDRFGTKKVYIVSLGLFTFASLLCGLAWNVESLILFRVLQGAAGGMITPIGQAMLFRAFPPAERAAAAAILTIPIVVAPASGPVLGGYLVEYQDWPWIFFINVPLALFCAPIAWRMLKRYEDTLKRVPIDKIGLVLLIVAVGALQLMLDLGKEHDWFESAEIWALAIVAVIGLAAFLIWETTERHPIVDLRVFRHRGFSICVLTITIGFGGFFAVNVLTPLWLQSYMGYTSSWAGLATAWTGLLAIFVAPIAGMLMAKVDPRRLVCFGLLWIAAVSIWRVGATTDMTFWQVSVPLMLLGLGLPFFFLPITAHALASVAESETASAAGLMNFLRTLSGAFATSIATTAWENNTAAAHADLAGQVDRSGEATRSLLGSGMDMDSVRSVLDGMTQGQSVMLATNEIMATCAFAFCVAAALIWLAPRAGRVVDMSKVGH